jgi:3'-phosphoadenosine 5'-phosphosulfate sulfotransferase (PAPS reductase)/FAD synthetase
MDDKITQAEVIFVNHSGGKDSQAMLAKLVKMGLKDKLVIVHADLGEMEWEPMEDWITENSFGIPVHVVKSELSFFELCRKWKRLPSGQARFCTSELKTNPCERFMKKYCLQHGIIKAISALGIRAEESPSRAKKGEFIHKTRLLTIWNPILDYKLADVSLEICRAGQKMHWVYSKGYSRLSCVMCVFGRKAEHEKMALDRPELFEKMADLEIELGKTIRMKQRNKIKYPKFLREYITPARIERKA